MAKNGQVNEYFVPVTVKKYLKAQLQDRRQSHKKAIDKTYNYWQGQWRGMGWSDFPDEKEARRLLKIAADEILSQGKNSAE
jgi:hypothetical protein